MPIEFQIKKCQFGEFNKERVEKILKEFEFTSLIKRLTDFKKSDGDETTLQEDGKTILKLL